MNDIISLPRGEYDALVARVDDLVADRDRLRELLEDAEDAAEMKELEARLARDGRPAPGSLPVAAVERLLAGESPLRVWREHRGLTLVQLGAAAGIAQGYLSEIENRKKPGSIEAWKAIARVLDVPFERLLR